MQIILGLILTILSVLSLAVLFFDFHDRLYEDALLKLAYFCGGYLSLRSVVPFFLIFLRLLYCLAVIYVYAASTPKLIGFMLFWLICDLTFFLTGVVARL